MLKVIMMASDIPNNETITKIRGEVEYKITDRLILHTTGDPDKKQDIKIDKNCKILINPERPDQMNIISDRTELIWHIDEDSFIYYLQGNY